MAQKPPITEKHRKSTGCTHENTIIRSLLLWQDAVLRGSTRRHDGLHVDLQRRRRFFCVQLRGKGPLCHRQPDDAPFHRPDGPGLHDGDRGRSFRAPLFAEPVGAVKMHYGDKYDDLQYNSILVNACAQTGIAAFTGDGTDERVMKSACEAIGKAGGAGVPTVKPWNRQMIKERCAS